MLKGIHYLLKKTTKENMHELNTRLTPNSQMCRSCCKSKRNSVLVVILYVAAYDCENPDLPKDPEFGYYIIEDVKVSDN